MERKKQQPDPEYFEQLALGLELPEEDRSERGFISPADMRLRSIAARDALKMAGVENMPEWFDQYGALLDAGWPWRVACYIAWSASPKINRWPKTQDELATQVLGLTSDRVIATWRKKNPAIDDLVTTLQAAPLMVYRADAYHALGLAASDPDHRNNPDRKLFFQMTGDFIPHAKVDLSRPDEVEDLSQMSDAELDLLAKRLLKQETDGEEQQD